MNIREKKIGSSLVMILATVGVMFITSYIKLKEIWANERVSMVFVASVIYVLFGLYLLIRENNIKKVATIFGAVLISMAVMSFIPYEFRPWMLIFMLVAFYFNIEYGVMSLFVSILSFSYLLGINEKYIYAMAMIGFIGVIIVKMIKNRLMLFLMMALYVVMAFGISGMLDYYYTGEFDMEEAYLSFTPILISVIVFVNIYIFSGERSVKPFAKENSWASEIIKEKSLALFYHSVEVAELSKVAAEKCNADKDICYAGGILYELGKTEESKDSVKMGIKLAAKIDLPKSIKNIIIEHGGKYRKPTTKESAIVLLADSIISSIDYLKQSGKEVTISKVVDNIMNVRMNQGVLSNSKLTVEEYIEIKKGFIEYFGGKDEHLD